MHVIRKRAFEEAARRFPNDKTVILFTNQKFYVKHIVTHAEYDKLCRKYRKEM